MATNYNTEPYYDDYNENKGFHRILFKPGVSVQARELTQLQTIIQKQIERHGQAIYKEGAAVTGCEFGYTDNIKSVKLNTSNGNDVVDDYLDQIVGFNIRGASSGVEAKVIAYTEATDSDPSTIYVTFNSVGYDKESKEFFDDENLYWFKTDAEIESEINDVNGYLEGETIFTTVAEGAVSDATTASVERGIIFTRGNFVLVPKQRIIISKYSKNPTVRVGLLINEYVLSAEQDQSLLDPAQNSPNFSARGADRLVIELNLAYQDLDQEASSNFIEMSRVIDGRLQPKTVTSEYSLVEETLARRTFDESGNYSLKPYELNILETVNDGLNNGIYTEGRLTDSGNIATDDLMTLRISSGKSYVQGYEVSTTAPTFMDIKKPRTSVEVRSAAATVEIGNYLRINTVRGLPDTVGTGTGDTDIQDYKEVKIYEASGDIIGVARPRNISFESGSVGPNDDVIDEGSVFKLFMFDIRSFTKIVLDSPVAIGRIGSIPAGTLITGETTGASGYVYSVDNLGIMYLTSVTGSFRNNEKLISSNALYSDEETNVDKGYIYSDNGTKVSIQSIDIKSIENATNVEMEKNQIGYEFSALVIRDNLLNLTGSFSALQNSQTITAYNSSIKNDLKIGDIVTMPTGADGEIESFRVTSITWNGVKEISYFTVDRALGGLGAGPIAPSTTVAQFGIVRTRARILEQEKNILLRKLAKDFTKTLRVESRNGETVSTLEISREFMVTVGSEGKSSTMTVGAGSFKAESNQNYQITVVETGVNSSRSVGEILNVDSDELNIIGEGSNSIYIESPNLLTNGDKLKVNTTVSLSNASEKTKILEKASTLRVANRTNYDNDGSAPYGTCTSHKEISLGVADVFKVWAVYDSNSISSEPTPPSLSVSSIEGTFVRAEVVRGENSGAIGVILGNSSPFLIIPQNNTAFESGEIVEGLDSGATATVESYTETLSSNITDNFYLDTGQRDNFYDIGRLRRKSSSPAPRGNVLVVFDYFTHGVGNFFSVDSYSTIDYDQIPSYSATRIDPEIRNPNGEYDLRSCVDFRPRVADTPSAVVNGYKQLTQSSFDFKSRNFEANGSSTIYIPRDNSTFTYDYEYYLARKDSVYLTTEGKFKLISGIESESPILPKGVKNAMKIADITMPPYVIDVNEVNVKKYYNRRYTMSDIGLLENRINNIEYYTSLSLLEANAAGLQIKDENGADRFKSGFLVDNFGGHKTGDVLNTDYKCAVDMSNRVLRPKYYMRNIELLETLEDDDDRLANGYVINNNIVTLPFEEVVSIKQEFASRVENLNPVLSFAWAGIMTLDPSSDEWFEVNRLPDVTQNVEGNFDTVVAENRNALGTVWGATTTNWTGVITDQRRSGGQIREQTFSNFVRGRGRRVLQRVTGTETGVRTRQGIETMVVEQIDIESAGDRVLATALIPFMRQKQIRFEAHGLKPNTRVYPFFDKVPVSNFVSPLSGSVTVNTGAPTKVLQEDGVFSTVKRILVSFDKNSRTRQKMTLEVASSPTGPYTQLASAFTSAANTRNRSILEFNLPDSVSERFNSFGEVYFRLSVVDENRRPLRLFQISEIQFFNENYDSSPVLNTGRQRPGGNKSAEDWNLYNSLIPNVRYASISDFENFETPFNAIDGGAEVNGYLIDGINYRSDHSFYSEATTRGQRHASITVRLRGGPRNVSSPDNREFYISNEDINSGALVTSPAGSVAGLFTIPDPNTEGNPRFQTGTRLFRLSSDPENGDQNVETFAQAEFTSTGILETRQETFIATRNGRIETRSVQENTVVTRQRDLGLVQVGWWDPLAQSVMPSTRGGEFVTSVDVFFASKDSVGIPVTLQIREMVNGIPTRNVVPGASITISPWNVKTSLNASVPTNFKFPAPVYLKENVEVCIVLMTDSQEYTCWISQMGENDVDGIRNISEQPYLGVLFKSQNNSTWTPYDYQDLKFTLYRASFDTTINGTLEIENSPLEYDMLRRDPIQCAAGSPVVRVDHEHHGLTSYAQGLKDVVSISGIASNISTTLYSSVDENNFGTIFIGKVDSIENDEFPTSGNRFLRFRSRNTSEIDSEVMYGTLGISGDDLVFDIIQRGVGGSPVAYHFGRDDDIWTHYVASGVVPPAYSSMQNYYDFLRNQRNYQVGSRVELYELNGICLSNLNRTHEIIQSGADHYYVDLSANAPVTIVDNFNAQEDAFIGGYTVKATFNALADSIQLMVPVLNFPETSVDITTYGMTGRSTSGYQQPYLGYPEMKLETGDVFDLPEPLMIANTANENLYFAGNKSFKTVFSLSTNSENVSPVIDLERKSITTYMNKVDYIEEKPTMNAVIPLALHEREYIPPSEPEGDTTSAIYITKRVQLKNPATAIKVFLDVLKNPTNDVQLMYKILRSDDASDFDEISWTYFNENGGSDTIVSPVADRSSFREHEYSVNNLPEFISFAIKIRMLSTNSAEPPLVKDLRAIALAL
jgi:hypothetical protein